MFYVLLRSIRKYSWLRILLMALICSSIGSGLTFIIVFGELIKLNASPSSFALAFILSTTPGFLGSIIGKYMLERIEAKYCIIMAETIGALGLLIPWYGLANSSVAILQLTGTIASLAGGIMLPALTHYIKANLEPEDIGAGAVIDTLTFACHVLFGIGVGVLLYGVISNETYLLVNLCSYIISIILIFTLPKLVSYGKNDSYANRLPKILTPKQRSSLYLLPALTLTGASAIALLPTLFSSDSGPNTILYLLFSRSLGQLLGPFVINEERYKNQSPKFIIGCMAVFIICYLLVPMTPSIIIALLLVFVAHIFSNIVFGMGWYSLLTNFEKDQVAAASVNSYRKQLVIGAVVSIIAGLIADKIGSQKAVVICSITGLLLSSLLLFYVKRQR